MSQNKVELSQINTLPQTSGIYIFWGDSALPLYIGKSVNIRSRVMSHMRAADEAKMIAQSRQVEYVETAGEMGALLLEAWCIKQQSPLYNVRLRRLKSLCTIKLINISGALTPQVMTRQDLEVGQEEGIYGLFGSTHSAQKKLRELASQHNLCMGLLGLEKISKRGCFGVQLRTCQGACVGLEDRAAHDQRLQQALIDLKIHIWPFDGAIYVVEQAGDWVQRHHINNWRYLGTWCSKSNQTSEVDHQRFDLDTYKIVVKPIMLGTVKIEPA
jgi:excinuclease Cho